MLQNKGKDKNSSVHTKKKTDKTRRTKKVRFISFTVKRTGKEFVLEYDKGMKMIVQLERKGERTSDWHTVE